MSSEALHNGAHILLAAGIVFLVLTVIFAIKFDILQMLKTELAGKKAAAPEVNSASAPVHTAEVHEDAVSHSEAVVYEEDLAAPHAEEEKPVQQQPAELSATMVVSSKKAAPESIGTVVASRKKKQDAPKDDYVIIENIIVIHGDPNIINI
jgi:hypothetical protein